MRFIKRSVIAGLIAVAAAFDQGAYFESRTILIPHDDKIHRGGEDSAHAIDTLIAVADGVGGWQRHGVNPGLFSKLLTRKIKELHLNDFSKSTRQLIVEAHRVAAAQHQGSATLVVVKIDSEDTISTKIIGDSGYALFHVVTQSDGSQTLQQYFKAKQQQRSFNFPLQISSQHGDQKTVGINDQHKFEDGDVLPVYSDGVGDNLFDSQYIPCVQCRITDGLIRSYGEAANCLAKLAYGLGKKKLPKSLSGWSQKKVEDNSRVVITMTQQLQQLKSSEVIQDGLVIKRNFFAQLVTVYHNQQKQMETVEEVKMGTKLLDEL